MRRSVRQPVFRIAFRQVTRSVIAPSVVVRTEWVARREYLKGSTRAKFSISVPSSRGDPSERGNHLAE